MQETGLGEKRTFSDAIAWHTDLKFFDPPPEFFETPQDIGGRPPEFGTLDEAERLIAELSVTVAAFEALAAKMRGFLHEFEVPFESAPAKSL
jgi:hypothetical protein